MSEMYRIRFETVVQDHLKYYMNADPAYHGNVTQMVPNLQIPEHEWYEVKRETSDPWDQFWTLRKWADAGEQFVRNVRLERLVTAPEWASVSVEEAVRIEAAK